MQRFLTKEKTPIELVADEMSHELHFKVTREQAMERLCNQYLNNRLKPSKADATKEKKSKLVARQQSGYYQDINYLKGK